MRKPAKILSMILAVVMVLGLLPATAFATGAEDVVYLSISLDTGYIDDKNGIGVRFPTAYEENTEPTIGFYYNAFSLCLSGKFWKCKPE